MRNLFDNGQLVVKNNPTLVKQAVQTAGTIGSVAYDSARIAGGVVAALGKGISAIAEWVDPPELPNKLPDEPRMKPPTFLGIDISIETVNGTHTEQLVLRYDDNLLMVKLPGVPEKDPNRILTTTEMTDTQWTTMLKVLSQTSELQFRFPRIDEPKIASTREMILPSIAWQLSFIEQANQAVNSAIDVIDALNFTASSLPAQPFEPLRSLFALKKPADSADYGTLKGHLGKVRQAAGGIQLPEPLDSTGIQRLFNVFNGTSPLAVYRAELSVSAGVPRDVFRRCIEAERKAIEVITAIQRTVATKQNKPRRDVYADEMYTTSAGNPPMVVPELGVLEMAHNALLSFRRTVSAQLRWLSELEEWVGETDESKEERKRKLGRFPTLNGFVQVSNQDSLTAADAFFIEVVATLARASLENVMQQTKEFGFWTEETFTSYFDLLMPSNIELELDAEDRKKAIAILMKRRAEEADAAEKDSLYVRALCVYMQGVLDLDEQDAPAYGGKESREMPALAQKATAPLLALDEMMLNARLGIRTPLDLLIPGSELRDPKTASKEEVLFHLTSHLITCAQLYTQDGDVMSALGAAREAMEKVKSTSHPIARTFYENAREGLLITASGMLGLPRQRTMDLAQNLDAAARDIGTMLSPVNNAFEGPGAGLYWVGEKLYDAATPLAPANAADVDTVCADRAKSKVIPRRHTLTGSNAALLKTLDLTLFSCDPYSTAADANRRERAIANVWSCAQKGLDGNEGEMAESVRKMAESTFGGNAIAIAILVSLFTYAVKQLRLARAEAWQWDPTCAGRACTLRSDSFHVIGAHRVARMFTGIILVPAYRDKGGDIHRGVACLL